MRYEEISYETKKKFADALKQAMKKKPFSKITVSELISACQVNRKTFYYHFQDIYELLHWIFEEEAIDIVKNFDPVNEYDKAIAFVMDYVEENDYLINCVYDSFGREEIKRLFYPDFSEIVSNLIERTETEIDRKLEPGYREFLIHFFTEACAGMLIRWAKDREGLKKEEVIAYISKTVRTSLGAVLST